MKIKFERLTEKLGITQLSFFIIFAFAMISTWYLRNILYEFPDPSGANGYFYLKQTESLSSGKGFYFKDYSLAFALPVFLMKIFGDSLEAFRISILVVWFFIVCGSGLLLQQLLSLQSRTQRIFGLILGCGSIICVTQLYEFTMTFFKNAFGLSFLLWALYVWNTPMRRPWKIILASLFILLALLSHKSMIFIAGCFILAGLAQKISWRLRFLLFGICCTGLGIFLWHFEKAGNYLMALLRGFSSPQTWWQWLNLLPSYNLELGFGIIFLVASLVLQFFCRLFRPNLITKEKYFLMDGACLFLVMALHPFQLSGPESAGYRMLLIAPALIIPILIPMILIDRSLYKKKSKIWDLRWALTIFGLLLVQPWMKTRHLDDVFTPWMILRDDVMQIRNFVRPEDHLTSHHGLEFFVDDMTGIRSRSFLSEDPKQISYRLAYVSDAWLPSTTTQDEIRQMAILEIGSEYVLLKEEDWKNLVQKLKIPNHWKNPDKYRPDFIYN